MIKVAAVNYLNTKPLLFGLFKHNIDRYIHLQLAIPAHCARLMESGEVDLALMPVAAIPGIPQARVISEFCIGAIDRVDTVCVFSECPISSVTDLYLDAHSRTSVQLLRLLMEKHWQISPRIHASEAGYEQSIGGTTAALIIGDRAIAHLHRHAHTYDLATEWHQYSNGLPFVFAAWVANRDLPEDFIDSFNAALAEGIRSISQLKYLLRSPQTSFDLEQYFTNCISYELTPAKRQALEQFLTYVRQHSVTK